MTGRIPLVSRDALPDWSRTIYHSPIQLAAYYKVGQSDNVLRKGREPVTATGARVVFYVAHPGTQCVGIYL